VKNPHDPVTVSVDDPAEATGRPCFREGAGENEAQVRIPGYWLPQCCISWKKCMRKPNKGAIQMVDMMQLSEFLQKGRAKEVKELVQ
jgi:hypothetical protein